MANCFWESEVNCEELCALGLELEFIQAQTLFASSSIFGFRWAGPMVMDGPWLVVGWENGDDQYVYVFKRNEAGYWIEHSILLEFDPIATILYGRYMAIDNGTLIIGDEGDGTSPAQSGCVYIYTLIGDVWTFQQKLKRAVPGAFETFGYGVALSGDTMAVGGAHRSGEWGRCWIFTRSGAVWTEQTELSPLFASYDALGQVNNFNSMLRFYGGKLYCSDVFASRVLNYDEDNYSSNTVSGCLWVLTGSGASWSIEQRLEGLDPHERRKFASHIDVNDNYLAVGSLVDEVSPYGWEEVSAWIFKKVDGLWVEDAHIIPGLSAPTDVYWEETGPRVAISDTDFFIGDFNNPDLGYTAGAVYHYEKTAGGWAYTETLTGDDTDANDDFGGGLLLSPAGTELFIGAPGWPRKVYFFSGVPLV